jgi:hypothetical protein
VIEALRRKHPVGISSTYLAHSIPAGRTAEDYTNEVIAEHLPALAKLVEAGELNLDFIDVFCERGFFDAEQSRQIMEVGKRMGLAPSFHGDELTDMDCGVLAANVGAKAVSHLEELSAKGIAAMAAAKVVGVLLPTTAHVLRLKPPPARAMIEGGVAVVRSCTNRTVGVPLSAQCLTGIFAVVPSAGTRDRLQPQRPLDVDASSDAACVCDDAHVDGRGGSAGGVVVETSVPGHLAHRCKCGVPVLLTLACMELPGDRGLNDQRGCSIGPRGAQRLDRGWETRRFGHSRCSQL